MNRALRAIGAMGAWLLVAGCGEADDTGALPPASGGASNSGVGGTGGVAPGCPTGRVACGSACVDTWTDQSNCGICGNACAAGQSCTAGACQCVAGLTPCGNTCVDTSADGAHCGACGQRCTDGQSCAAGTCVTSCPSGTLQCGTGCVDPSSNPLNCGTCGNRCAAGRTCVGGVCSCPAGQTACGAVCTTVTGNDPANCGACGVACGAGVSCVAGACTTGSGGSGTGGSPTGGQTTGGSSTGGIATGGTETGGATGGVSDTGGVTTGGVTTGGEATGGEATGGTSTGGTNVGGSETCRATWEPPAMVNNNTDLPAGLDAVWEHSGPTILDANNIKIYQLMANEGAMRYCVRWDSDTVINATQRDQIEALIGRCEKQWIDQLAGWGCWPYPEVSAKVTLWAARDRAVLNWPDGDTDAGIVINSDASCPRDCGPWDPNNPHSSCSSALYDEFFWLDGSVTSFTGWGSATGFMMGADSFLSAASSNSSSYVILAHEMGHAHGLDDFYDWQPEGWSSWVMRAGSTQSVTATDGWMLRDVWRHVRSRYGYPGP